MKKTLLALLLVPSMVVAMGKGSKLGGDFGEESVFRKSVVVPAEESKKGANQLFAEFDAAHKSVIARAWLTQGAGFALLHPAVADRIITGENTSLSGLVSYCACVLIGQAVLHATLGGLTGLHKAERKFACIEAEITRDVIQDAKSASALDSSVDGISIAHHVNSMQWSVSGYNRWAGWRLGRATETRKKGLLQLLEK